MTFYSGCLNCFCCRCFLFFNKLFDQVAVLRMLSDASHTFRQWFKLSKWGLMSCDWLILICICIEKTFFFKWCQCLSNIPVIYIFKNISIYMLLQYIVCCLCLMSFQRRKSVALPGALTLLHHDSNLSHCIWFLTNVLNSRLENKQMCI